jgi:hypothetical protein
MNNKNMMTYSFFIIPAISLLVVGGQRSAKIVQAACDPGQDQAWRKGYNDAQNDVRAGNSYDENTHLIFPPNNYKAGYSQGYVDAGDGPMLWIQIKNKTKTKTFQVQGKDKRTKTSRAGKEVQILY